MAVLEEVAALVVVAAEVLEVDQAMVEALELEVV